MQNQNILKHRQEGSAALDLGSQSACQSVLQPRAMETPWGTVPVLDLLTLRGQRLSTNPASQPCLAWYCHPSMLARSKRAHWQGSAEIPAWDLPASLLMGLLPRASCILDPQKPFGAELQLCFSDNSSVFLFSNPAPWITYPPVSLPGKLILPSLFFNGKTWA